MSATVEHLTLWGKSESLRVEFSPRHNVTRLVLRSGCRLLGEVRGHPRDAATWDALAEVLRGEPLVLQHELRLLRPVAAEPDLRHRNRGTAA